MEKERTQLGPLERASLDPWSSDDAFASSVCRRRLNSASRRERETCWGSSRRHVSEGKPASSSSNRNVYIYIYAYLVTRLIRKPKVQDHGQDCPLLDPFKPVECSQHTFQYHLSSTYLHFRVCGYCKCSLPINPCFSYDPYIRMEHIFLLLP